MANNGDQDSQREHRPKRARNSPNLVWSSINSEQNSPESQTADKQQLDQPGDAYGFLQSSVNRGGIPQLTQLHLGQQGARNFIDQGREQPQALIQQQPDTSRGKKRLQQQSAPDSHSPEIRQTIPDRLARKRLADKRYRERIKDERQQTKAALENLTIENGQLNHENQKMKAENGQLKAECSKLKSEVEKLKAENGQLTCECQGMRSQVVEPEAENRYSSRKNNDTFRSFTPGSGPPQSSTSGFQDVGPTVQPSNINPFDDWSHNRDNGVDEYFTVEEIRIRSHEMLENEDRQLVPQPLSMGHYAPINMPEDGFQNEDMQFIRSHEMLENEDMQLLRIGGHASISMPEDQYTNSPYFRSPMFGSYEMLENEDLFEDEYMQFTSWLFSMEGHAPINMPEDRYTSPSKLPEFDEERSYSGKIIRGWLKIRAVIKWGSVTRKAA